MIIIFMQFANMGEQIYSVAELKYESGCRDVSVLRLYKDFGIMQNHFHTMESATPNL